MAVYRVTAEWTGFSGAPGFSVMHFSAIDVSQELAQAAADAVGAFFFSIRGYIAPGASVRVSPSVDVLNEANGDMEAMLSVTQGTAATSSATGSYSAVSGAVVHWITNDVKNSRRVRGKNFIVPLASSSYDAQGTIGTVALGELQAAANALITKTPVLQVWSRPSTKDGTDGSAHIVTSARVPDKACVLRSRRD